MPCACHAWCVRYARLCRSSCGDWPGEVFGRTGRPLKSPLSTVSCQHGVELLSVGTACPRCTVQALLHPVPDEASLQGKQLLSHAHSDKHLSWCHSSLPVPCPRSAGSPTWGTCRVQAAACTPGARFGKGRKRVQSLNTLPLNSTWTGTKSHSQDNSNHTTHQQLVCIAGRLHLGLGGPGPVHQGQGLAGAGGGVLGVRGGLWGACP